MKKLRLGAKCGTMSVAKKRTPKFTSIELFAGAGGMSEGFSQAGFEVAVATDFNPDCAETHKFNHPNTPFIHDSIENLSYKDLLQASGIKEGDLDVMAGGPPCQGFSINAPKRNIGDPRNALFKHYVRLVSNIRPRFVVLENVPGMLSFEEGKVALEIVRSFKEIGYTMEFKILYAPDFGVPQERRRVFFIGNRLGLPITFPKPSYFSRDAILKPTYITVEEAIGDLPEPGDDDEPLPYPEDATVAPYAIGLRKGSNLIFNHCRGVLGKKNLNRIKYIPQGGSWRDIPVNLLPEGMKRAKRSDHTKRYGRLHPKRLASTILTKCDPHWGAYIHPKSDRILSAREAARFQGFPDKYRFLGKKASQYAQVGNAVPVPLARAVASLIKKAL